MKYILISLDGLNNLIPFEQIVFKIEDFIICEHQSRDTYENVKFSVDLLLEYKNFIIAIVSDSQHVLRVWITFYLMHKINAFVFPVFCWIGWKKFLLEWAMLAYHLVNPYGIGWIAKKKQEIAHILGCWLQTSSFFIQKIAKISDFGGLREI